MAATIGGWISDPGLFLTFWSLVAAAYIGWRQLRVKVVATADSIITLTPGDFLFKITVLNRGLRQALVSAVAFEVPRLHEYSYATTLFSVPQRPLTDGEEVEIRIDGNRIVKDLGNAAWYSRHYEKKLPILRARTVRAWIETSSGHRFRVTLSAPLRKRLHTEVSRIVDMPKRPIR